MSDVNPTTDQQVLSACLRVNGAIDKFAKELDPKDVGYVHGVKGIYEVYKAMLSYHKATKLDIIDPVAFKGWLAEETDIYEVMGGDIGVTELYESLMPIELPNTDALIKLAQHRATQRRRLDRAQELHELIGKSDLMDERSQLEIGKLTEEINTLYKDMDYNPLSVVRSTSDILAGIGELFDIPPFLPTPYKSLNRALGYSNKGGFFRGGVHSVVAMSGRGKSTFTKCLCNYWLDSGYTVLFVNFEEPQSHWERILMTQRIGVNVYAEAENLDSVQLAKISEEFRESIEPWGDRLMVRHDPDTLFFEDLEKWMRDILGYGARKPDVVVIDTIQSMFTKTGGHARWGDFEQIMVRLEKLAKDMDAAFVLTAQQNLNSTRENRQTINMADIGGSVTIPQKSTVAMFLVDQQAENDDAAASGLIEIQIPKNRITGTAFSGSPPILRYDDSTKSFYEFDPSVEDPRYNQETVDIEGDIY